MKEFYSICGIISPLSFALVVIVGGFLIQGYSHTYNTISELTVSNISKKPTILILFSIYNVSLILFAIGLSTSSIIASSLYIKVASSMLILIGILGIAMLYYIQDPRNMPMSYKGKIHIVLAGLSSVFTMIVIILAGLCFWHYHNLKDLAIYSFISFGILFITGGITAINISKNSPYGGLFERLTIGAFMQWVFVISLFLY
jgi:hypothetical protein